MVTDHFATFGLPRCVALDEEALKQAYTSRTRETHPDQEAGDEKQSTELNTAFEILSAPEKRLRHLIELEADEAARAWKTIPLDSTMMGLFDKLAPFLHSIGDHTRKKQSASSALAKALLSGEEMKLREIAEERAAELTALRESLEAQLPDINARRLAGDTGVMRDMQILQAKLAYLAKWQAQVREAFMALV
jgi:curved DNA-binding protein CbpA